MHNCIQLKDYVEILLQETLDGIMASELSNIERIDELKRSISLNDEEFAKKFITDNEIREQMLLRFPTDIPNVSAIDPGQPYRKESADYPEDPPIYQELDYKMTDEDYELLDDNTYVISSVGYIHLFEAMKKVYTSEKRIIIKQLLYKGIPNLYVDRGEISSKIYFNKKNVDCLFNNRKNGLICKCYDEWVDSSGCDINLKPVVQEVCSHFSCVDPRCKCSEMITFKGFVYFSCSDLYKFYVAVGGRCIVKINNQIVFSTYQPQISQNQFKLKKGFYNICVVCDNLSINQGVHIYYTMLGSQMKQEITADMLFYEVEDNCESFFDYKDKKGSLSVSLSRNQEVDNKILGELKLFYHITHE